MSGKYKTEDFELVDLYISYDSLEANFIHEVLSQNDIANFVRDMAVPGFPMNVGQHGQHRIVVEIDRLEDAAGLIRQAIEDGAITGEGRFFNEST